MSTTTTAKTTKRSSPLEANISASASQQLLSNSCQCTVENHQDGSSHVSIVLNSSSCRNTSSIDSVDNNGAERHESSSTSPRLSESVLEYERAKRKFNASQRAGQPLTREEHLKVVYHDEDVVVVNKPSGVLNVPGTRHRQSLLNLVFDEFVSSRKRLKLQNDHDTSTTCAEANTDTATGNTTEHGLENMDQMIIHRLDMDTSGVVLFALNPTSLQRFHEAFRRRKDKKVYEALVCGHIPWDSGVIDLPLQRSHTHPPFMRVATPRSEHKLVAALKDLQSQGYRKLMRRKPKESMTQFEVMSHEFLNASTSTERFPVTRLRLSPKTGRTHQLRVHCAAMGFPIVGDPVYGWGGEAEADGGLDCSASSTSAATLQLQEDIYQKVVLPQEMNMCLHAKSLKVVVRNQNREEQTLEWDALPVPF